MYRPHRQSNVHVAVHRVNLVSLRVLVSLRDPTGQQKRTHARSGMLCICIIANG